jgi:flavodoxin
MKALVIYDSVFGNTEKIALAVGEAAGAQVVKVGALQDGALAGVTLLLVGSPTRGFRPTEGIQKLLKGLPKNALKGVAVGGFDTRMDVKEVKNRVLTFMEGIFGYAAEPIAKALVKCGGRQAVPPAGFFVHGSEGPLWDGELERAKEWGRQAAGKAG